MNIPAEHSAVSEHGLNILRFYNQDGKRENMKETEGRWKGQRTEWQCG